MSGRVADIATISGFACSVAVGLWNIAFEIAGDAPELEPDLREILEQFELSMQELLKKQVA